MSAFSPVYFEIIDFIAAGTTPDAVAQFHPSLEAQQRVADLIEREKLTACRPKRRQNLIISWNWSTF